MARFRRRDNATLPENLETVIDQNIQALVERRRKLEESRSMQNKVMDSIAAFTGSVGFIYVHAALLAIWLGLRAWAPSGAWSFQTLAGAASVEAIFLATLLMINQNRTRNLESHREDLDLQINLLVEHELTRVARVCELMAAKLGIDQPEVSENLGSVKEDVPPAKVLDRIEAAGDSANRVSPGKIRNYL